MKHENYLYSLNSTVLKIFHGFKADKMSLNSIHNLNGGFFLSAIEYSIRTLKK